MSSTAAPNSTGMKSMAQAQAEDEHKVKRISLLYLCAFIVLTGFNIVFATMWLRSKQKAEETIVQLARSRAQLDSANTSLGNFRKTDSANSERYKAALENANPVTAKNIEQLANNSTTLYLQYIDSYGRDLQEAIAALRASGYNPRAPELMNRANFSSVVKYFRTEDRDKAAAIASVINQKLARFTKDPIRVLEQKLAAPAGQIEIWLGEPQQDNAQTIIDLETSKLQAK